MAAALIGLTGASSAISASSANKAAKAQENAANKSAEVQWDMYSQTREDQQPFMDMGYAGIPAYMKELGFTRGDPSSYQVNYVPGTGGGSSAGAGTSDGGMAFYLSEKKRLQDLAAGANENGRPTLTGNDRRYLDSLLKGQNPVDKFTSGQGASGYYTVGDQRFDTREEAQNYANGQGWQYGGFQEAPGYQYNLEQGEKAINRNAAVGGRVLGGQTLQEMQRHAVGLADQGYQTHLNRLAGIVGQGSQATGTVGAAGQNYAAGASNAFTAAGNARASGYEGTANAFNSGVNNLASMAMAKSIYPNAFSGSLFG